MTLLEIIIVVIIVSLIATGIAISVNRASIEAKLKLARSEIAGLAHAVEYYQLENGTTCPSLEDLKASRKPAKGSRLKYPWGNPYVIVCDDSGIDVHSAGPDAGWNLPTTSCWMSHERSRAWAVTRLPGPSLPDVRSA
jgi:type II secretory pathway pseudopilin PulG